jgi:hypothetical protein
VLRVQSLYFLMTTASTVGYGDLNPSIDRREKTSLAVRQFVTVLLIFLGICVIFARLSNLIGAHAPSTVVTAALRRSECRHGVCGRPRLCDADRGRAPPAAAPSFLRPRPAAAVASLALSVAALLRRSEHLQAALPAHP